MSLGETLGLVADALANAGIEHMVAGSVASTIHGEPRATQDIDIVIDPPTAAAMERFVETLDTQRFYVGDHRAAYAARGMFNVIDKTNGWKVDLIVKHDRPFSHAEFERRQPATIEGVASAAATPEDIILSKLEWMRLGESERQRNDVRAIVRASGETLDRAYLQRLAKHLGVADELERILAER